MNDIIPLVMTLGLTDIPHLKINCHVEEKAEKPKGEIGPTGWDTCHGLAMFGVKLMTYTACHPFSIFITLILFPYSTANNKKSLNNNE